MKQKILIILCLGIIMCTACYPTSNEQTISIQESKSSSNNQSETKEFIEIPGLTMNNIHIYDNKLTEAAEVTAELHEFDKIEVKRIMGKDLTLTLENEFSGQNSSVGQYIEFNDGSSFSIESGRISYCANLDSSYMQTYYSDCGISGIDPKNLRDFYKLEELNDFSLQNAKEISYELIKSLNIESVKNIGHISVDAQTVNANKISDKHGTPISDWTTEQELYTFQYTQEYNNIPLLNTYIVGSVDRNMNVVLLTCNGLYNNFNEKESKPICNYSDALNALLNYYNNMILDNPINISNCMLTYNAVNDSNTECILSPVWTFTVETIVDGISYPSYMLVDAYTRQVVLQGV